MARAVSKTETPGKFRQVVSVDGHTLHADVAPALGGEGSAPGPHEYFDASLATCKALTAMWFGRQHRIPLERVEVTVERDDSRERQGVYALRVALRFEGAALTDDDRKRLTDAVARCPVHKLMTTTDVQIETVAPSS